MSPAKSNLEINGPRPSPLLISKDSRAIRKPCNSHSSFVSQLDGVGDGAAVMKQQQRQPVIIYTHSPKIIHTQPKDFMALVQRLTGFTRSNDVDERTAPPAPRRSESTVEIDGNYELGGIDNESCSVLTEENNIGIKCNGGEGQGVSSSSYGSPMLEKMESKSKTHLSDSPLFTPRSMDLFGSPRQVLRYPDTAAYYSSSPANLGNSMSPSFVEFLKGLPEF